MDEKKRKIIEEYWLKQLAGDPAAVTLPIYKRYTDTPPKIKNISLEMSSSASLPLSKMSKGVDIALFILYLSGINILLYRYAAGEDLLLGSVAPPKEGQDEQLLFLRNRIDGDILCKEFVGRVKQTLLNAVNHGYAPYDFDALYKKLQNRRQDDSPSGNMFNIAVIYEPFQRKVPALDQFDLLFVLSGTGEANCLKTNVFYNASLYNSDTLHQFCRHLDNLFSQWPGQLDTPVSSIDFMDDREKQQILIDFNDTQTDFPREKTLGQLFVQQVEIRPNSIALVGSSLAQSTEPNGTEHAFTYHFLDRETSDLAGLLIQNGVGPGTIVAMLTDRSLEMIIGILAILKAGGTYLPLDPTFPQERLRFMVKDADARILLTHSKYMDRKFPGTLVIDLEDRSAYSGMRPAGGINEINVNSGYPAYIIYTSGTTGIPKGTLVTHANALRVVKDTNYIQLGADDRVLQLSNYAFDVSVFDINGALLNGSVLVLVGEGVTASVGQLADLVISRQITVFFATTALFNLLVDMEINCFNNVRKVLFGGERVSFPHSRHALEHMGTGRILHMYGPTETAIYATYYPIDSIDDHLGTVPIGKPLTNTVIHILDPRMNPVPIGVPGEIYISGEAVARGYLNRPELTHQYFIKNTSYPSDSSHLSHKSYRTGDLARWLPDGNIEFLDRIDQQVKVRGFRIELGEIENRLITHPSVKEAVVITRTGESGDAFLCAFIVSEPPETFGIKEYLSETLPPYMIPAFIVPLRQMPLTPNGKVDRKALSKYEIPDLKSGTPYSPPRDNVDETLVDIWARVLKKDKETIGIDDNFFEMGGHSLKATVIISEMQKAFNVRFNLGDVSRTPVIRQLSNSIKTASKDAYTPIPVAEKREYYSLTPAQQRVYTDQRKDSTSTHYNMLQVMKMDGIIQADRLERAFRELTARHESFRTSFVTLKDRTVQRVASSGDVSFSLQHFDVNSDETQQTNAVEKHIKEFNQPFDLAEVPLLRAALIKLSTETHVLMVDMHHIIYDGVSHTVFVKELTDLYDGRELPHVTLQYKDYVLWQTSNARENKRERTAVYWSERLTHLPPALKLPYDYTVDGPLGFAGDGLGILLTRETREALEELAVNEGTTLFTLLLTAFFLLLNRVCRNEDIVVGVPTAGRDHADLNSVIGMFVNSLPVRSYPQDKKNIRDFLKEVKEYTLTDFEHQDFRFEDLPGIHTALFNVMFAYTSFRDAGGDSLEIKLPGVTISPYPLKQKTAKFDLTMWCYKKDDGILTAFEYRTQLFKKETIELLLERYQVILNCILDNPDIPIKNLQYKSEIEQKLTVVEEVDFDF